MEIEAVRRKAGRPGGAHADGGGDSPQPAVAEIDKRIEAGFRDHHTIQVITSLPDRARLTRLAP